MSEFGELWGHIFDDEDSEGIRAECFLQSLKGNIACGVELDVMGE